MKKGDKSRRDVAKEFSVAKSTVSFVTKEDIVATVKLNNEDHDMDAENEEYISNSQLP